MTPERLSEIMVRRAAIDPLMPLTLREDYDYLDGITSQYDVCAGDSKWAEAFVRDSEELAQFIMHAPQDIDDLLAEVKSLLWELRQKEEAE